MVGGCVMDTICFDDRMLTAVLFVDILKFDPNKVETALPGRVSDLNNREFVEKLVARSLVAQSTFFESFFPYLKKILLNLIYRSGHVPLEMDEADADSQVSEAIIKILKKIDMFDIDKGTLQTWAGKVAKNHFIDYIRSRLSKKAKAASEAVSLDSYIEDNGESVLKDEYMPDIGDFINLDDALLKFGRSWPEYAKIVELLLVKLHYYKEFGSFTQKELAKKMNTSESTICNRMKMLQEPQFQKRLADVLTDFGIENDFRLFKGDHDGN